MDSNAFSSSSSSSCSSVSCYSTPRCHRSASDQTPPKRDGRKKKPFRGRTHPVYRGIRLRKEGKWVCEICQSTYKKGRVWLGTFPCAEMAARAYDVAALALRGESALLNFDDSAWLLPRPASKTIKDIRAAAVAAAEAFRPLPSSSSGNVQGTEDCWSASSSERHAVASEEPSPTAAFVDEEALFNMPILLASMAEGLLMCPPAWQQSFDWDDTDDQDDLNVIIKLWSD